MLTVPLPHLQPNMSMRSVIKLNINRHILVREGDGVRLRIDPHSSAGCGYECDGELGKHIVCSVVEVDCCVLSVSAAELVVESTKT